jgi:hypothetical protein
MAGGTAIATFRNRSIERGLESSPGRAAPLSGYRRAGADSARAGRKGPKTLWSVKTNGLWVVLTLQQSMKGVAVEVEMCDLELLGNLNCE